MLDRDGREQAAFFLRRHAAVVPAHGGTTIAESEMVRALADAVEAEPEGYDYEAAAAERGEALEDLIAALDMREGPQSPAGVHVIPNTPALRSAIARGEEVMEGVERTHVLLPRELVKQAATLAEWATGEACARSHTDEDIAIEDERAALARQLRAALT